MVLFFFFFKQKTAYEIGVRLVGSEMCIRDSSKYPKKEETGSICFPYVSFFDGKSMDGFLFMKSVILIKNNHF